MTRFVNDFVIKRNTNGQVIVLVIDGKEFEVSMTDWSRALGNPVPYSHASVTTIPTGPRPKW